MKFNKHITISLLIIAIFIWFLVFLFTSRGLLNVYFLDVGQGDAIFIETPEKIQILIDGGPDNSVLSELSKVMPFYDKSIDIVAISHPQKDHIMGLVEVFKRYKVDNVLFSSIEYKNEAYKEIKKIVKEKNINIIEAKAGERIELGEFTYIDILYPFSDISGDKVDNANDVSLAFILDFLGKRFLFSGDAEVKEELDLVNSGIDLNVDVLKINHHGSKTSSSSLFLEKTKPDFVVISVGKENKYNHPNESVLKRLSRFSILRTDIMGRVRFFTDGSFLKYELENN